MSRNPDFHRDMGSYLKSRNVVTRTNPLQSARSYLSGLFSGKPKREEEIPMDIPEDEVQAVLASSSIRPALRNTPTRTQARPAAKPVVRNAPTSTMRTPTRAQPQQQVNKMGWFSSKKRQDDDDDDYEMVAPQAAAASTAMDEDVKEVLKITFKWLKMMDPETVEAIKGTSDFEKYKKVLDKYGLIKK